MNSVLRFSIYSVLRSKIWSYGFLFIRSSGFGLLYQLVEFVFENKTIIFLYLKLKFTKIWFYRGIKQVARCLSWNLWKSEMDCKGVTDLNVLFTFLHVFFVDCHFLNVVIFDAFSTLTINFIFKMDGLVSGIEVSEVQVRFCTLKPVQTRIQNWIDQQSKLF